MLGSVFFFFAVNDTSKTSATATFCMGMDHIKADYFVSRSLEITNSMFIVVRT